MCEKQAKGVIVYKIIYLGKFNVYAFIPIFLEGIISNTIYLDSEAVVLLKLQLETALAFTIKMFSYCVSCASVTKIFSFSISCVPYLPICKLGYLFSKGLRIKKAYNNVLFICKD